MAPDAQPFSVFDFIWSEIRSVGERPFKGCGFAPYIMFMIEKVTGHTFEYDKKHKVLKIVDDLTEIGVPLAGPGGGAIAPDVDSHVGGAAAGRASPLPHAPSHSSSRRRSPPSPIRKMFNAIFGMCKDIWTYQQKERKVRRKDTQTLKQIASRLELDPPRSPLLDEVASEPETKEQQ